MAVEKAQDLVDTPRTRDVVIEDNINFSDFLLSETTLEGLNAYGFKKPSPIQRKAIPLGRCGFDLIVQAKSGTGKTCVFTVVALEMVEVTSKALQVLILSPTREISVQIKDVISAIGKGLKNLKVEAFIGGMSLEADKKNLQKCQIAVGAPGRVRHLVSDGLMKLNSVRLFVLDEADKLMEDNFRKDISFIFLKLPEVKQIIAASATFPQELEEFVVQYMINPMRVSPGKETFLIGIRQFISIIPYHLSVFVQLKNKIAELLRILSTVPFKQCLVFSNYQSRAESICNILNKEGWPAVHVSGSQKQDLRLKALSSLKEFRCRVLLSTDLTSRGIDAENVNLVINLDLPYDGSTYMHRIGRAGRYGTYALAVTIVQSGSELEGFRKMLYEIGGGDFQISLLPKDILNCDIWNSKEEDFEKICSIEGEYKYTKAKATEAEELEPKNLVLKKQDEESIKSKALEKLLASRFTVQETSKLDEWDELEKKFSLLAPSDHLDQTDLELSKQEEVQDVQQKLCYKDFSPEEKFPVIFLEKMFIEAMERPRQKVEHQAQNAEVYESEEYAFNNNWVEVIENKNEQESSLDEGDEEDEGDEGDEDDRDEGDEYSTMESEYSSDESESIMSMNSLYIKQWYSMWYSQLLAIRQYVNYLKHFYYCKALTER